MVYTKPEDKNEEAMLDKKKPVAVLPGLVHKAATATNSMHSLTLIVHDDGAESEKYITLWKTTQPAAACT